MLDLGSSGIGGMFFGDDAIDKAYIGEDLVYEVQHGPKITVTTYKLNIIASSTYKAFYLYRNFVVGAEYKFEYSTNARNNGYVRIAIQSNGQSSNLRSDTGTYTKVVTNTPSPMRCAFGFSQPSAGTLNVTITETINPS